jgi:hypothetical protein
VSPRAVNAAEVAAPDRAPPRGIGRLTIIGPKAAAPLQRVAPDIHILCINNAPPRGIGRLTIIGPKAAAPLQRVAPDIHMLCINNCGQSRGYFVRRMWRCRIFVNRNFGFTWRLLLSGPAAFAKLTRGTRRAEEVRFGSIVA